jgi:hypothetical protein
MRVNLCECGTAALSPEWSGLENRKQWAASGGLEVSLQSLEALLVNGPLACHAGGLVACTVTIRN